MVAATAGMVATQKDMAAAVVAVMVHPAESLGMIPVIAAVVAAVAMVLQGPEGIAAVRLVVAAAVMGREETLTGCMLA